MSGRDALPRGRGLALALAASLLAPVALAQAMDPHMHMPMPTPAPGVKPPPALRADGAKARIARTPVVTKRAGKQPPAKKPPGNQPPARPPTQAAVADHAPGEHAAMDGMQGMDGMDGMRGSDTMDGMDHSAMDHVEAGPTTMPRTPIPVPTDAARAAAVPPAGAHAMAGSRLHRDILVDQLERWDGDTGAGLAWRAQAWIGGDIQRLWIRSEGERIGDRTRRAEVELLYGRAASPWWTVLGGIRHDVAPGGSQDFLALGVAGTAPYKIDVAATGYIGGGGQGGVRLEAEYKLLLTRRLVLQPHLALDAHLRDDAARGIGSGPGTLALGLRLRYQVTPRFAPYIGVVREQAFGGTADQARAAGEDPGDTRLVAGVRFWF